VTSTSTFTTTIATSFEKLEITNAYTSDSKTVIINVKNTGLSDATITDIFVNGKPLSAFNGGSSAPGTPISLTSGATTTITLTFTTALSSGTTYDIKIHTASGTDYPKAVAIP
jgi:archaellum component FlaF (FlaF/FlaG flagellin family)